MVLDNIICSGFFFYEVPFRSGIDKEALGLGKLEDINNVHK